MSESPEFSEACAKHGILFIGPKPETMRTLGNKVAARNLAVSVGVPVMLATEPLSDDPEQVKRLAAEVGYPVMLKASWGGGGRGMRPIESEDKLLDAVQAGKREAKAAFGKDEVYLEKLVRRARHIEVQLLGDTHASLTDDLRCLVEPTTRGDPQSPLLWTCESLRKLSQGLRETGHKIGRTLWASCSPAA